MTLKYTNNRKQEKPDDFVLKYGNQKHNRKAEWMNNMTKELEGLEEGPKAEIHINLLKTTLKKCRVNRIMTEKKTPLPSLRKQNWKIQRIKDKQIITKYPNGLN